MRISKTFSLLAGTLLVVGVAAGGCGGSSSSGTSLSSVCSSYCAKCNNASAGIATVAICANCSASTGTASTCTNESAIATAFKSCAQMSTCSASETCFENDIPECQKGSSGTGSGGSAGMQTGSGGSGGHASGSTGGSPGTTGSAGSGGTADCSVCDTFVNSGCCGAFLTMEGQPSSNCTSVASACSSSPSSVTPTCQQGIAAGAALGIASCK